MKRFLKATLPLLALTGSMLIAQDDPDAKQPPERDLRRLARQEIPLCGDILVWL